MLATRAATAAHDLPVMDPFYWPMLCASPKQKAVRLVDSGGFGGIAQSKFLENSVAGLCKVLESRTRAATHQLYVWWVRISNSKQEMALYVGRITSYL